MAFDGSAIQALLQGAVAKGAVHGVAALVVDRQGVLFQGTAGEARADTLYRNASMTKAVATTAALQLVEQGRLGLDDTVASILPEFGQLQVLDGFDGDQPRLRPPASAATVRQLMTHTAGLGYFFTSASRNACARCSARPCRPTTRSRWPRPRAARPTGKGRGPPRRHAW